MGGRRSVFKAVVFVILMFSVCLQLWLFWQVDVLNTEGMTPARSVQCVRPQILIDANHGPEHFFVVFSLIHWFSGGDLPYHSPLGPELQALMENIRRCGSDVWVSPDYVGSRPDRMRIIDRRFPASQVSVGWLEQPDLRIVLTTYADFSWWFWAMRNGMRNNHKILLINHNWHTWWVDDFWFLHGRSLGMHTWNNVWGLMPPTKWPPSPELLRAFHGRSVFPDVIAQHRVIALESGQWFLPTYFPFPKPSREDTRVQQIVRNSTKPVFCFQSPHRRDMLPLVQAFRECHHCDYSFIAVTSMGIPSVLEPYREHAIELPGLKYDDEYHLVFQRCTYMLPLLNERTDPAYLNGDLASTIAYGVGYGIPFVAWDLLQISYPMMQGYFYKDSQHFTNIIKMLACHDEKSPWPGELEQYRREALPMIKRGEFVANDGSAPTWELFDSPIARKENEVQRAAFDDEARKHMGGSTDRARRQHTCANKTPLNCTARVRAVDVVPSRSPQAVHTALLPYLCDMEIVELGTQRGDGMQCFAQVAKAAFAIEPKTISCWKLWFRSLMLHWQGLGKYSVLCGAFPERFQDADVFLWWQDLFWPTWRNLYILQTLKNLQDEGRIRKNARTIMLFDSSLPIDRFSWRQLRKLFSWSEEVPFNESTCSDESLNCLRSSGSFFLAEIPLSSVSELA